MHMTNRHHLTYIAGLLLFLQPNARATVDKILFIPPNEQETVELQISDVVDFISALITTPEAEHNEIIQKDLLQGKRNMPSPLGKYCGLFYEKEAAKIRHAINYQCTLPKEAKEAIANAVCEQIQSLPTTTLLANINAVLESPSLAQVTPSAQTVFIDILSYIHLEHDERRKQTLLAPLIQSPKKEKAPEVSPEEKTAPPPPKRPADPSPSFLATLKSSPLLYGSIVAAVGGAILCLWYLTSSKKHTDEEREST